MVWISRRPAMIGSARFVWSLCAILTLVVMSMALDHNLRKPEPESKLDSHLSDEENELLSSESITESQVETHLSDENESPGRDLQTMLWFPQWGTNFNDGICLLEEKMLQLVPGFSSLQECCEEWFPGQPSGHCLTAPAAAASSIGSASTGSTGSIGPASTAGTPICNLRGEDCSTSRCCSDGSTCKWSGIHGSDRYYCGPSPSPPADNPIARNPPVTVPVCNLRGEDCSTSRCCSDGSTCKWSGINGSDRHYCGGTASLPNPSPGPSVITVPPPLPIPPPPGCKSDDSWEMPDDYLWKGTPFAGKKCNELASFVPSDELTQVWKFCEFLSQGVYSSPTVMDACCFCGGGNHIDKPSSCKNMEWNSMECDLDCEFIESLPEANQDAFCNAFGNATFSDDGLTMKDACCVCGGGSRDYTCTTKTPPDGENPGPSPSPSPGGVGGPVGVPALTGVLGVPSVIDINFRNIAFVPGVPNLEYLGLGYDLLIGNPRGSSNSELDPGFRYRILRLVEYQANRTVDDEFTVPLGVDVKYTSSCKYDDSSVEVSSEKDVKESLSKEAKIDETTEYDVSLGITNPIRAFSASFKSKHSFSRSEKFQRDSETNTKTSSTSFEARAICSEFEASFVPGYDHVVTPEFKKMRDNLPVPFNKAIVRHVEKWSGFFNAFGAFYVKHVVLGGKRIHSTSMSQQDYSDLVSESVDVESTLSFEMSAGIKASQGVKVGMVKAAGELAAKKLGGPQGEAVSSVISVVTGGREDKEDLFGANVEASRSTSLGQFASNKKQAENALKISNKKLKTIEYTFGGLPSEDWRAWSQTVRQKPMPIQYELGTIFEFLSYEQKYAFIEAYEYIYNIDLNPKTEEPFLKGTTHHGVYNGKGDPLSIHTLNPNDDSRVLLKVSSSDPNKNDLPVYDTPDRTKCSADKEIKIVSFQVNFSSDGSFNTNTHGEYRLFLDAARYFPLRLSDCDMDDKFWCEWKDYDLHEIEDKAEWRRLGKKNIQLEAEDYDGWPGSNDITRADLSEADWYDDICEPYAIKAAQKEKEEGGFVHRSVCWDRKLDYPGKSLPFGVDWCDNWALPDEYLAFHLKIRPASALSSGNCRDSTGLLYSRVGKEFSATVLEPETCFSYCSGLPDAHHQVGVTVRNSDVNFCYCEYDYQKLPLKSSLEEDDESVLWQGSGRGTTDLSDADGKLGSECYPNKNFAGRSPFVKYADIFKGKTNKPAAIFATPIRGKVAVDVNESNDNSMFENDNKGKHFMMSFTKNINFNAELAIASFGGSFEEEEESVDKCPLPNFSFITTQTLERYGADFRSGIVLHDGVLADEVSRDNFYVTSLNRRTTVQFVNQVYEYPPTVIVFSNWYTCDDKEFPTEVEDVSFVLESISTDEFVIQQTERDLATLKSSNLGFNFLVIGSNMTAPEVEHGIEPTSVQTQNIAFSTPFADIPSVVVTPYDAGNHTDIPRCIVESITKEQAEVKCLWVATGAGIPFTWIAVGHK